MILIKCCDISNEVRPIEVSEPWADCLLEEYFMQVRMKYNIFFLCFGIVLIGSKHNVFAVISYSTLREFFFSPIRESNNYSIRLLRAHIVSLGGIPVTHIIAFILPERS